MTQALLAAQVSVFQGSTNTQTVEIVSLAAMLQRIHDGAYHQDVERLRGLLTTKGKGPYDSAKKHLMAFTPAGVFAQRANAKLTTSSSLVHFDFDHPANLATAKARLIDDPFVVYAFISPSGDGLKFAVWVDGIVDDTTYKHAWTTVLHYFESSYPDLTVANDAHCKDIARLCYCSYDPDLYSNANTLLFTVPPYQPPAAKPKPTPLPTSVPLPADRRQRYARQALDTAVKMIDASLPPTATSAGTRHAMRLKAARLLGGYITGAILTYAEVYPALEEAVARNTDDLSRSMKTIADGLQHGQDHPITFDELEAQRLDWLQAHRSTLGVNKNGSTSYQWGSPPGPEPADPYACPELPVYAHIDEQQARGASLFLNDYIAFSQTWAPRAYEGFHEAVALFVLATTAARRVRIALGGGMYTSLYIALAARTTLYTKTTAADIGLELIRRTGLRYLLADDDATPQALLRAMAGYVDAQYKCMDDLAKLFEQRRLALSAQRGWFYEEWGQHLDAMMDKRGGVMASFRSILRRLDDHKEEYVYSTIGRGRDVLKKPYLTLLANVTPADLQPFVKKDSKLWRDGFIARMSFVSPPEGTASDAEFPLGERVIPSTLIADLDSWHRKLGIPDCTIDEDLDAKGHPKGTYTVTRDALPETTYTLSDAVWKSYYAYDRALRELTSQRKTEYLDGSYARFPVKALRIAGLLASLHDGGNNHTIWPTQWARAQQITERWRGDLHHLIKQVHSVSHEPSAKRQLEEKLIRQATTRGPQTLRDFATFQKTHSRQDIEVCLATLVTTGDLVAQTTTHATKYGCPSAP